jgi:hypothetical protein
MSSHPVISILPSGVGGGGGVVEGGGSSAGARARALLARLLWKNTETTGLTGTQSGDDLPPHVALTTLFVSQDSPHCLSATAPGVKASALTGRWWPFRLCSSCPVAALYRATVPSIALAASSLKSELYATASTKRSRRGPLGAALSAWQARGGRGRSRTAEQRGRDRDRAGTAVAT